MQTTSGKQRFYREWMKILLTKKLFKIFFKSSLRHYSCIFSVILVHFPVIQVSVIVIKSVSLQTDVFHEGGIV